MNILASALIQLFIGMLGWKYVWGAYRKGVVDCSGAFRYAYALLKSWMYHGSNTMYKKYSYQKGKIGEVELLPGQPVYKFKMKADGTMDVHHVGLYIGGGWVIEAKGALYGVILSRIEEWHLTSKLRSKDGGVVIYDVKEATPVLVNAKVVSTGKLNMRSGCTALLSKNIIANIAPGESVQVLTEVPVNAGWSAIKYGDKFGVVQSKYIQLMDPVPTVEARLTAIERRLDKLGV